MCNRNKTIPCNNKYIFKKTKLKVLLMLHRLILLSCVDCGLNNDFNKFKYVHLEATT